MKHFTNSSIITTSRLLSVMTPIQCQNIQQRSNLILQYFSSLWISHCKAAGDNTSISYIAWTLVNENALNIKSVPFTIMRRVLYFLNLRHIINVSIFHTNANKSCTVCESLVHSPPSLEYGCLMVQSLLPYCVVPLTSCPKELQILSFLIPGSYTFRRLPDIF